MICPMCNSRLKALGGTFRPHAERYGCPVDIKHCFLTIRYVRRFAKHHPEVSITFNALEVSFNPLTNEITINGITTPLTNQIDAFDLKALFEKAKILASYA